MSDLKAKLSEGLKADARDVILAGAAAFSGALAAFLAAPDISFPGLKAAAVAAGYAVARAVVGALADKLSA